MTPESIDELCEIEHGYSIPSALLADAMRRVSTSDGFMDY